METYYITFGGAGGWGAQNPLSYYILNNDSKHKWNCLGLVGKANKDLQRFDELPTVSILS
jgi:hypothetical protein